MHGVQRLELPKTCRNLNNRILICRGYDIKTVAKTWSGYVVNDYALFCIEDACTGDPRGMILLWTADKRFGHRMLREFNMLMKMGNVKVMACFESTSREKTCIDIDTILEIVDRVGVSAIVRTFVPSSGVLMLDCLDTKNRKVLVIVRT